MTVRHARTTRPRSDSTGWPDPIGITVVHGIGRLLGAVLGMASLGGCADTAGPLAAVGIGSIVVAGRTPIDIAVSAAVGRDCSVVRLDRGKSYCKPVEPPPPPPAFCTRSLAAVDCWEGPSPFGYYQRGLADGPSDLTAEQERHRSAPWPRL